MGLLERSTLLAVFALCACATVTDHGRGRCMDYQPLGFCESNQRQVCDTDDRGCRSCACMDNTANLPVR